MYQVFEDKVNITITYFGTANTWPNFTAKINTLSSRQTVSAYPAQGLRATTTAPWPSGLSLDLSQPQIRALDGYYVNLHV